MRHFSFLSRRLGLPLSVVLFFLAAHLPARAQTASVQTVYSFGPAPDGIDPAAAMVQASDGNFYGTTRTGGTSGNGTIFQYDPFTGVYAILHNFSAVDGSNVNADGADPASGLIQGQDGNLYGTTVTGGANGVGTVFNITLGGTLTTLHSLTNLEGASPSAALLQTADGAFYGAASAGGAGQEGTLFKITADGTVTVLYAFQGTDGAGPSGTLVQGPDGSLYGVTDAGGSSGDGSVFKITTAGTLTTLHSFDNTDGAEPRAALCLGTDGNFYGTTESGGANSNGTVFTITPAGAFTLLYQFAGGQPGATDGANPFSGLVQGPDGNFYGTTYAGGSADEHGTLYEITPAGALTTLYRFTGGNDGANPTAALTIDQRGDFYGVSGTGGTGGGGTIFQLNTDGILAFSAATASVSENAGSVTLTVNRTGGSFGAVGVTYATEDGTALAGTDYTATSGTLAWAAGDVSPRTITVPVTDRGLFDGSTRGFDVALSFPTGGAVLQSPAVETVTINETDAIPTQPTIALDSPASDGLTILTGSTLTIAARVTDPDGVLASVQFTVNGATVGTAGAAGPYVFTGLAPTAAGTYTVGATATDTLGRTSASTRTVIVRAQAASGDPAPSAAILTDLNGRAVGVGQTIPITAVANTDNGDALQQVDFYAGGVLIASFDSTGAPLTASASLKHSPVRADAPSPLPTGTIFQTLYQVPTTAKLVNLIVVAFTKLGVSTASSPATIHPVDPSVGQPPVVGLSGLSDGATVEVGAPVSVGINVTLPTASRVGTARGPHRRAAVAGTLADLELYLNAALLQHGFGNDPSKPSFVFTPPSAGDYVVEAIATDTDGLSGLSTPIKVHAVGSPVTVTVAVAGDGEARYGVENAKVVIRRTGSTAGALTVSYRTKGAAKAGVDFKGLSGTVVIPAGAAQAKLKFKPLHDAANTGTLKAKVVLSAPADGSYVLGAPAVAKVRVVGGE